MSFYGIGKLNRSKISNADWMEGAVIGNGVEPQRAPTTLANDCSPEILQCTISNYCIASRQPIEHTSQINCPSILLSCCSLFYPLVLDRHARVPEGAKVKLDQILTLVRCGEGVVVY